MSADPAWEPNWVAFYDQQMAWLDHCVATLVKMAQQASGEPEPESLRVVLRALKYSGMRDNTDVLACLTAVAVIRLAKGESP